MTLDSIFLGAAYKRLVQVDLPHKGSHQHELNGSRILGKLLGFEKLKSRISWRRFSDESDLLEAEGEFTWYDAREKSAARTGRSEWRFYYTGEFLSHGEVGDVLIITKTTNGEIFGLVFEKDSRWLTEAGRLLGIDLTTDAIQVVDRDHLHLLPVLSDNSILRALNLFPTKLEISPSLEIHRQEPNITGEFKFRPASRLIATIGQDLIKDPPAALIELVKNAYDADASQVTITIENVREPAHAVRFEISDNGHGMTRETVVNAWLVPATPFKSARRYSPNGRRMQGNKGIGRYAAFVLGDELLLRTVTNDREETTILLNWRDFEKHEFLDQVPVLVESVPTDRTAGTTFEITGDESFAKPWTKDSFDVLRSELRKLISPFRDDSDPFKISLRVLGFPEPYSNLAEEVESLSLLEFFDYRLSGTIGEDGTGSFLFQNQVGNAQAENSIDVELPITPDESCGRVEIDLRVYDRDPDAITELIARGLHDPETGKDLGKREARALLNLSSGVAIFRGDFKIRPYGDPAFDWLELDKDRVQNPSLRIGNNQILGFVRIQPEEISHLEEKSARDGLKENIQFATLRRAVKAALAELEQRRFVFRRKIGRGRKRVRVDEVVSQLTDFESAMTKIEKVLIGTNIGTKQIEAIRRVLAETGREKEELIGQIQETIAIYQGQATLGKIIMVLLHEGRKPIGYFRDMGPIISGWIERLRANENGDLLSRVISRLENMQLQATVLTKLFDRLEPLSVRKRHKARKFPVIRPISKSLEVFQGEISRLGVSVDLDPRLDTEFTGWEEDFLLLFANLIENSLYWFDSEHATGPEIQVQLIETQFGATAEYMDNGPGIPEDLIKDQSIFEPGFSTKTGGTGLGLAIAGEAAERNGCKLQAHYSDSGAKFVLELFPGIQESEAKQ